MSLAAANLTTTNAEKLLKVAAIGVEIIAFAGTQIGPVNALVRRTAPSMVKTLVRSRNNQIMRNHEHQNWPARGSRDGITGKIKRPEVEEFIRLTSKPARAWGMADSDVVDLCNYILALEKQAAEMPQYLKSQIDCLMNAHLIEMKPNYDDSITGFNEAWDIVRKFLG